MNRVACSDETTENSHLNLQPLSTLQSFIVRFGSLSEVKLSDCNLILVVHSHCSHLHCSKVLKAQRRLPAQHQTALKHS